MQTRPPAQHLFNEYQPLPIVAPIWRVLKTAEIAITLCTLGLVCWEIISLDRNMIFQVLWWTFPAVLAAYGALARKSTPMGRFLATSFLLLLAIGFGIAKSPNLFPDLGKAADPNNVLSQLARHLPLISRRILFWYIGVYSFFFLIFVGYFSLYTELRARRQGRQSQISPMICYFGLAVLWGIPTLAGIGIILAEIFGD